MFTSKENQIGLAKQATRKWKADHVVFETKKGHYSYKLYDGKIKGEVISYKELIKEDKKQAKELDSKKDTSNKPKENKTAREL